MVVKIPPHQTVTAPHPVPLAPTLAAPERVASLLQPPTLRTGADASSDTQKGSHLHALYKEAMDGDGIEETSARAAGGRPSQQRESGDSINDMTPASMRVDSIQDPANKTSKGESPAQENSTGINNADAVPVRKSRIDNLLKKSTEDLKAVDRTSAVSGEATGATNPGSRVSPTGRVKAMAFNPFADASQKKRQHEDAMLALFAQPPWKSLGPERTLLSY